MMLHKVLTKFNPLNTINVCFITFLKIQYFCTIPQSFQNMRFSAICIFRCIAYQK